MVTVVFAKSYSKKDCGNSISASVVFAFGFYSSNSNCSISVLVETMVTMVKITLALKCLSSSVRLLDVKPSNCFLSLGLQYSQSKIAAHCFPLTAHKVFFGYCSFLHFFFFSFLPPPHRAWTPFRLSFWMSVKLWLCIGPKWLMLDRRHPPAISWKGCASVCVLTLQACVLPYFLLRADSQRYFCVSAACRFNV